MCRGVPWQAFEPNLIVYFLEFPISALVVRPGGPDPSFLAN